MLYKQKGMLGRCLGSSGTDVLGRTTESLYMWLGSSCVWGGQVPRQPSVCLIQSTTVVGFKKMLEIAS